MEELKKTYKPYTWLRGMGWTLNPQFVQPKENPSPIIFCNVLPNSKKVTCSFPEWERKPIFCLWRRELKKIKGRTTQTQKMFLERWIKKFLSRNIGCPKWERLTLKKRRSGWIPGRFGSYGPCDETPLNTKEISMPWFSFFCFYFIFILFFVFTLFYVNFIPLSFL